MSKTLGAIASNEKQICGRTGKYATTSKGVRPRHHARRVAERERELKTSRRDADKNSNLTDAPKKPEWATGTGTENMAAGTSIFDPVLCELAYRWFSPVGGVVIDPFSGGSVRGIVAAECGREYVGVDLRGEQIEANQRQGDAICKTIKPRWITGDSRNIVDLCKGTVADLIFSCPPYADLEVYSDDPLDISTLGYPEFVAAYREIISASCSLLRDDRFACFVVGDARGKDGCYYGIVPDTIQAFKDAGLRLYNEAILVTACGSLPIRCAKTFNAGRKLGKTHQNVLVFVKGDAAKATKVCGVCDFGEVDDVG